MFKNITYFEIFFLAILTVYVFCKEHNANFPVTLFPGRGPSSLIRMCSWSSWNSVQTDSGRPNAMSWSPTFISSSSPSTRSGGILRYLSGLFSPVWEDSGVTHIPRHSYMQKAQAGHLSNDLWPATWHWQSPPSEPSGVTPLPRPQISNDKGWEFWHFTS